MLKIAWVGKDLRGIVPIHPNFLNAGRVAASRRISENRAIVSKIFPAAARTKAKLSRKGKIIPRLFR
jgi:hypothetical protein